MDPILIIALVVLIVVADTVILFLVFRKRFRGGGVVNPHWQWLAERCGLEVAGGEPVFPSVPFLRGVVLFYNRETPA